MIIGISGKAGSGKDLVGEIIQYLTRQNKDFKGIIHAPKKFKQNLKQYPLRGEMSSFGNLQGIQPTFIIKKFADSLKDIVCLLIGCTREQLEDEDFKNTELGEEWWIWKVTNQYTSYIFNTKAEALESQGGYYEPKLIKPTPRFLLQNIGTDLFRKQLHPNIWVNALMNKYKDKRWISKAAFDVEKGLAYSKENDKPIHLNWVITDMRFPNELKAVEDRGGIIIRISRFKDCEVCKYTYREQAKSACKEITCPKGRPQHISETALDNAKFKYTINNNSTIEELIKQIKSILIKEKLI